MNFRMQFATALIAVAFFCGSINLVSSTCILSNNAGSGILATSVRDLNLGVWVSGIPVDLYYGYGSSNPPSSWCLHAQSVTNSAGKIPILVQGDQFPVGRYRLVFQTESYFTNQTLDTFYPYAEVQFDKLNSDQRITMLVPILVSQYSYTSYRGSLA